MVTTRAGTQITAEPPPEPQPIERKRQAPAATRAPKRPRTSLKYKKENEENEYITARFTDVPVETFTEICFYLHPADLIVLARTCKTFRAILMKSSAEHIWRRSEVRVPNLPPYPWSNMSPPGYAALLFTRNCTVCGEYSTSNADPYLLVRLCVNCRETELVEVAGREYRLQDPSKWVCKTTLIHFKKKNAQKRRRGSGKLKYCLRKDLEQLETAYNVLNQPTCAGALARWRREVQDEAKLRQEFGDKLRAFSNTNDALRSRELAKIRRERTVAIEERLLDLGWTEEDLTFRWPNNEKWTALVEQPRPLTDRVWSNLFPKLLPLLETNRVQREERYKKSCKETRQLQVHKLLRQLKLDAHPLAPIVRQLGFEPLLRESKDGSTPVVVRAILECYPFVASSTALDDWPCFKSINEGEMTPEEVNGSFERHLEEIRERSDRHRNSVETDLVLRLITVWNKWVHDCDERQNYMVTVNDSEECTKDLPEVTRLLLRADVVFSRSSVDCSTGQGQVTYYPEFIPPNSTLSRYTYSWNQPPKFSAKNFHPHLEGGLIAKALLACIEKPDAAYLELAALEERFLCGRCFMQEPMSWKGIIQHYIDETAILNRMISTTPRFKTRHPIPLINTHNLDPASFNEPLVELLTVEGANGMRANPPGTANTHGPEYCIPCKNHGRMFVSTIAEQMNNHVQNAHAAARLTQDVHYGLISDSGTFLEVGGTWKNNWEAHYDHIESSAGVEQSEQVEEEDFGHDDLGITVAQQNEHVTIPTPISLDTGVVQQVIAAAIGFMYGTDSEEDVTDWGSDGSLEEDEDGFAVGDEA